MPVADNLDSFVIESGIVAVHRLGKNSWFTLIRKTWRPEASSLSSVTSTASSHLRGGRGEMQCRPVRFPSEDT